MRNEPLIRTALAEFYVPGRRYHSPLPAELEDWYAYCSDFGHSVLIVQARDYRPGVDLTEKLCPAPVKAVLRRYEVMGGYVVCDLPYSPAIGLQTAPGDDEL